MRKPTEALAEPLRQATTETPGIPLRKRLIVLGITWIIALIVSMPSPLGVIFGLHWLPLFPYGFTTYGGQDWAPAVVLGGWVAYFVLCIAGVKSHTKVPFFVFNAILIVLLLANIAGCQVVWHQLSKIEG